MKKIIRTFGFIAAGIVVLYLLARAFNIIEIYSVPTSSMAPSIKPGDYVFATKLVEPKRMDAIAFLATPLPRPGMEKPKEETKLSRLIGKSGDTVALKNGHAYVNGKIADEKIPLSFMYKITSENFNKELLAGLKAYQNMAYGNNYIVNIDEKAKENLSEFVSIEKMEMPSDLFWKMSSVPGVAENKWTVDDFGPIVIPEGHFFFLGDNRHNSEDSRIMGFIPNEKLLYKVYYW